jgi:7-carboxy-7-deazaguanine synthase
MGPSTPIAELRATAAPVLEVFASIQGEGLYVGEPQVLLRLAGCPFRCRWCDTPASWDVPAAGEERRARIAGPRGRRTESAWASPFVAVTWVADVEGSTPRTVSVTGGEPLSWPEFVRGLKPLLGARRLHLETAGGDPRALERVLDAVDHVSLDLKHPADLDPPVTLPHVAMAHWENPPADARSWAAARRGSLELVRGRDACGKLIVAGGRAPGDFAEILDDVARLAPELPLFLQPVTPMNGVQAPSAELVLVLVEEARERALSVRVVPQIHRVLGLP